MQRISISQLSTLRWSFVQDVRHYASQGFHSIGVWRQKISDLDILEAIDLLHEMKLGVSSLHWAGAFTGSDGRSHVDAIEDGMDAIELAAQLGADCLIVHPGGRNGHTLSHARRLFQSALRELAPIASDYEVTLGIEPMVRSSEPDWTFFDQFQDYLDFAEELSDLPIGWVLDLFHVGLCPEIFDRLPSLVDRLLLVQLSDRKGIPSAPGDRLLLGTGAVPIASWLARFQELGYEGAYELELHGSGLRSFHYEQVLESTKCFLGQETMESLLVRSPASPSSPAKTEAVRIRPSHE